MMSRTLQNAVCSLALLQVSIEKFHLKFTLSSNFIEKYLDIGDFFMLQYKHET
jgi:hypothetical protein